MTETTAPIPLDPQAAEQLIQRQFPELAGRDICHQPTRGTDNHIFRIGDDLCARFPKVPWAVRTARRETGTLPHFAGAPLPVPQVYRLGTPSEIYPHTWSVLSWLPGAPLEDSALRDPPEAARHLADFYAFLRSVPPDEAFQFGADNNWRGAPLAARTPQFETALARLPNVDTGWAARLWSQALGADANSAPVWLHGDVHPGNVLVTDGHISGIIDWGLCGVGDGACDLLSAWAMFDPAAREVFRQSMGVSEAQWLRGAGWALSMAVIYLPYAYENGLRCDMSEKMIERLMEDFA
ncbi:MAG: phosphotransferase [Hyphomonas sp.]|uniref:aminoglycoside phosphotransferase family protein n=1 Tax=Hyphomonas sp. TaxID=87 RepID=UPI001D7A6C44|nr:aminoglycoside phosphotransferase family protein [Hyphomonas sp.]MBA4228147.1 phosphotransferase [Hyphomonas sp.]